MSDERPPFWVIVAITVSGIMTNTMITAGLPDILRGVGASSDQAGLLVAAGSLPGVVLAALIGLLSDKWGRRELILPLMVVFAVSGASGALATNLTMLLAVRFVQGCASAGLINLGAVLIADHWQGSERGRMLGINAGILTTCLALFPFIGGFLVDTFDWRAPFLAYLVTLGPTAVAFVKLPRSRTSDVSIPDQFRKAVPHLTSPGSVSIFLATITLFVLIFGMLLTVLPIYAEEEFGLGATQRGLVLGLPAIGSTIAAFSVARVRDRIGARNVALGIGGLFVVALVFIGAAPSIPVLAVGAILFGLGEGSAFPTFQDRLAGSVPDEVRGTLMASQVSSARTGQVLGPMLAGGIEVAAGARVTYAVGTAIAALVLAPLALRSIRLTPEPVHDDTSPSAADERLGAEPPPVDPLPQEG